MQTTCSQIFGKALPPNTNRETTIEAVHIVDAEQAKIFSMRSRPSYALAREQTDDPAC